MASEDYTADLSVSTGILLCNSRKMSFKIYNEVHFDFPQSFKIRVVLGQFLFFVFTWRHVYFKCKIAEPLSFQLSLVIEHPKYILFWRFSIQ